MQQRFGSGEQSGTDITPSWRRGNASGVTNCGFHWIDSGIGRSRINWADVDSDITADDDTWNRWNSGNHNNAGINCDSWNGPAGNSEPYAWHGNAYSGNGLADESYT